MKLLWFCCVLFFCSICSLAYSSREVVTEHVTVVYSNPDHLAYAKRVAYEAEQALDKLIPLFRWEPRLITLIIDSDSGYLSGRATPFPHPSATIAGIDDIDIFGYRAHDLIYALVVHELFHVVQGTYSNSSTASPDTIIKAPNATVLDLQIAPVVPIWFSEGIATWAQTYGTEQYGLSGSSSARVTGIVETLALENKMPEFKAVGSQHNGYFIDQWPGRLFPYDLGGAFSHYLVETYGFEAILETLTEYNKLGFWGGFLTDFSTAWYTTQGTYLEDIWTEWQDVLKARAQARASNLTQGKQLTQSGYRTDYVVVSPDGSKLAWSGYGGFWIAQLHTDGSFSHPRNINIYSSSILGKFDWLDNHNLVYVDGNKLLKRNIHQSSTADSEKLSLLPYLINERSENKRRFGTLRFADSLSQDCVLLIQNGVYGQSDELWRWCNGKVDSWIMPEGLDLLDASASAAGQILVNVWQSGFTDFALLDLNSGTLNYLMRDVGQDLDPTWLDEKSIVFRSDRHKDLEQDLQNSNNIDSVFDLYRLDISENADITSMTRLTRSLGGAFRPAVHANQIWFATLSAEGYDVSTIAMSDALTEVQSVRDVGEFPATMDIPDYEVRGYEAGSSLLPDALVPEFFIPNADLSGFNFGSIDKRAGLALIGQDRARKHTYYAGAGYQFNPENDTDTYNYYDEEKGEVVEVNNTFEPHWYGYFDYNYLNSFGRVNDLEYENRASFKIDRAGLGTDANFAKAIRVTDNFKVKPSFGTRFNMSTQQYGETTNATEQPDTKQETSYVDRYSFGIQPALDLNFNQYFSDFSVSMDSKTQFSYDIGTNYIVPSQDVQSITQDSFQMSSDLAITLRKSFINESSVWDTILSTNANLRYWQDLHSSLFGSASITRYNTDNWYFNLYTSTATRYSPDSDNNQSLDVTQNFSYSLDSEITGFAVSNRSSYSYYDDIAYDIDGNPKDVTGTSLDFEVDLDAFYAFGDLRMARAFLGSRADFGVRPAYNPDANQHTETSYETFTSLATLSLESYDFESLRLGLNYQHPITWFANSSDASAYRDNYDDDWTYQNALSQSAKLSFILEKLYNPKHETKQFFASLEVGTANLYDTPFLYSDVYVGYVFDNFGLKDSVDLNIHLKGAELYYPNISLGYNAYLPSLMTWDGKYGFENIDIHTGIDYDIASNEISSSTYINFDTIFSYVWNIGFSVDFGYYNDEWRLTLY